jgi:hypothetical protein
MKSHNIQRLEFVLDKIKGGDYKREVRCICFDHPTKKNELVWGSPWEVAMAGVEASMGAHGELAGEGKEGEGKRKRGARLGALGMQGCQGEGCRACSLTATAALCLLAAVAAHVRKKRRKERRKRKGRKRKERKKEKTMEIFPNLKIFGEKNKRQFMKLVKNIFVQESYMSNYK